MKLKKRHLLLWLFLVFGTATIYGQKADKKKADLLYRAKAYAEAIPIYEKVLEQKKSVAARTKLAYCYKMLNQMDKAESHYQKVVNEKYVRPEAFYHYGEVLMSKSEYAEAKNWFLKYHELKPDDGNGLRMANACDQVPFITALFPQAAVRPFPHNSEYDDSSPVYFNNSLVFSSDRKPGAKLLKKKSGATGRDFIRLYASQLNGSQWSDPSSLSGKLNEHNKNNANASFGTNRIFFTRNGSVSNRKNAFTLQLFTATLEKGDKWKNIELLPFCRPNHNYMHPAISPDGNTLFFVSDKPGGKGGTDIYYAKRNGDSWGKAINLDSTINTTAHEGFPFMDTQGKLYFCSKGHIGYGGFDIFVSEQNPDGSWTTPVNVGQPINSSHDDISIYIDPTYSKGAFTSSRKGGDDDIYLFSLTTDQPALVVEETTTITPTDEITPEVIAETEDSFEEFSQNDTALEAEETIDEYTTIETPTEDEQPAPTTVELSNTPPDVADTVEEAVTNDFSIEPEQTAILIENNETTEEVEDFVSTTTTSETEDFDTQPDNGTQPHTTSEPAIPSEEEPSDMALTDPGNSTVDVEMPQTNDEPIDSKTIDEAWEKVLEPLPDEETMDGVTMNDDIATLETEVAAATQPEEVEAPITNTVMETTFPVEQPVGKKVSFKEFRQAVSKDRTEKGMYYVIEDLKYYPGEYMLQPKMTLLLNPLAKILNQHPELMVEIAAHTESIGYDRNNMTVSEKRAKAVKNYLLYKGVDTSRIIDAGYGETQLVNHCSNGVVCTEEEHQANQRIEVRLYGEME